MTLDGHVATGSAMPARVVDICSLREGRVCVCETEGIQSIAVGPRARDRTLRPMVHCLPPLSTVASDLELTETNGLHPCQMPEAFFLSVFPHTRYAQSFGRIAWCPFEHHFSNRGTAWLTCVCIFSDVAPKPQD